MENIIKDKKVIGLIVVVVLFSISYFILVTNISHAFEYNHDMTDSYNRTIETILESAKVYGERNIDAFNEEGLLYISVQDLVDSELVATNNDGNIINVLDSSKSLNDEKIRLKYVDDKVTAEIYS